MLKYGIICEVDYSKGYCRVHFDEIGIVSDWISLPTSSVLGKKECKRLPINTQVGVLMHSDGEQGEIVNVPWNALATPPSWFNENCDGIQYEDGTIINYDIEAHKLNVQLCSGATVEVNAKNQILDSILTILTGPPITEPGNGSPSALQIALQTALENKNQFIWES
jgi:phage baseplate assembly protein gpV